MKSTPHRLFTLSDVPGRGTQQHSFRLPDLTWERFGAAVKQAGITRTEALRAFVRWYLRYPGAELPERPDPGDAEAPR